MYLNNNNNNNNNNNIVSRDDDLLNSSDNLKPKYYKLIDEFSKDQLPILSNQKAHYFFDFFHNFFHKDFIWNMMWGGEFMKKYEIHDLICLPFALNNYFNNFDYLIKEKLKNFDEFNIIKKEINKNLKKKNFKLAKNLIGLNKILFLNHQIILKNKIKVILIFYLFFKLFYHKLK